MASLYPGCCIGDYRFNNLLGRGSFSVVYNATHIPSGSAVAIKAVEKSGFREDVFLREKTILQKLDFPLCCSFFDCFEDVAHWYLVVELVVGGSIAGLLAATGKPLEESHCRHFFCQLVASLDYLHNELGVGHRDLKLANLMIDRFGNLRLVDFGLSNFYRGISNVLDTACGSPVYAPPEMMKNEPYTMSADVWSAGVCLYVMAVGRPPFDDVNLQQLRNRIIRDELEIPDTLSVGLKDLISKLLVKDPLGRLTIDKIRMHSWFREYYYWDAMRFDFGVRRKWRSQPLGKPVIDTDVVASMEKLGIESGVEADISEDKFTPRVVAYRILKREKVTDEMQVLSEHRYDPPDELAHREASLDGESVKLMLRGMRRKRGVVKSVGEGIVTPIVRRPGLPAIPVDTVKRTGIRIISSRNLPVRYRINSPLRTTSESESEKANGA